MVGTHEYGEQESLAYLPSGARAVIQQDRCDVQSTFSLFFYMVFLVTMT